MKRKICVITGSRAEFGLLYWLIRGVKEEPTLQLQLIVMGMHLSPEFGMTYRVVEQEFTIDKKIEMLLSSDSSVGISKSIGLAQISFAEVFQDLNPDMVVVLGDRFEIFAAASAAMIAKIPIVHLHGGETTEGAIDESLRHCINKMSHFHFTATEEYKNRVIQLGEHPSRVYNVGGLGLDNIQKLQLLNQAEFEDSIGVKLQRKNLLITFHPVTLEDNTSEKHFQELLDALDSLQDTLLIFTKANADNNGRIINQMIDAYCSRNVQKSIAFHSLGSLRFLSALQYMDAMVGNSSSGLIEAPAFKLATINIGDRQKGRVKAKSVLDCAPNKAAVQAAIRSVYSVGFQAELQQVDSPYGTGGASATIIDIIKKVNLKDILQKKFYNLDRG